MTTSPPEGTRTSRVCSWAITTALPPVMVSPASPSYPGQDYRSRADYMQKRASLATVGVPRLHKGGSGANEDDVDIPPRHIERSPRRSLGAVWRVSSSSPARQLGVWLGRRPRSFTSVEDTALTSHLAVRKLVPPPPPSPTPSHCSSSPESPSPMDPCKGISSSPSAGSLLVSPAIPNAPLMIPQRPTKLVITGRTRARPRRLSHTPTVTRYFSRFD